MCGRFVQYQGLADYLAELNAERGVISGYDNVPITRYNVAPSTKVHMLYGDSRGIHLGAVKWGWAPHWAKPVPVSSDQCPRRDRGYRQVFQIDLAAPRTGHGRWLVRMGAGRSRS